MKKNLKKGFTLIELLVVIAIIGILSGIVLASLNTARSKGSDAAVKGNLTGIRPQAELVYDTASPNSYATICTDGNIVAAIKASKNAAGVTAATVVDYATTGATATATCHANGSTGWAVEVPLKTAGFFCVDSSGNATTTAGFTLGASDAVCG